MPEQQVLPLATPLDHYLDDFIVGDNDEVIAILKKMALGISSLSHLVWIHGPPSCGKSHLLEALCAAAKTDNRRAAYVGLSGFSAINTSAPRLLNGYSTFNIVCLDDIDATLSRPAWEEMLFHLYNELDGSGSTLVMSARMPVCGVQCTLPDLASRLSASVQLRLRPLNQAGLSLLLQQRGRALGLHLSAEVQQWLLRRIQRDVPTLLGILDYLDRVALSAQRRLTIPFMREVLKHHPDRPFYT